MAKSQTANGKIKLTVTNAKAETIYNGLRELDGTVTESHTLKPHIFYGETVFQIARNRRLLEPIVEVFQQTRNVITAKHANERGQVPASSIEAYNQEVKPVLEAEHTLEFDVIPKKSLQLKSDEEDKGNNIMPGVIAAIYDLISF